MSSLVDELLTAGFVAELSPARGVPGRPASPLQLNRSGPAGLGVEIGGDAVAACAVDLAGTVRARRTTSSGHRFGPPAAALGPLAALAAAVVAQAAGRALGIALASALNLLDLPAVVLGGGYPQLGGPLLAAVEQEVGYRVLWRSPVTVRAGALGADVAVRGAALSVVRGLVENPAVA